MGDIDIENDEVVPHVGTWIEIRKILTSTGASRSCLT